MGFLSNILGKHNETSNDRIESVRKINNPEKLIEIALNDEDFLVRGQAIIKINDQEILEKIAKNDESSTNRGNAVRKITNGEFLCEIAMSDSHQGVRRIAVENSNFINQEKLIYIAKNDEKPVVRQQATQKINDKEILKELTKDSTPSVAYCAKERLNEL